jgi:hypothetical protein
MASKLGKQDLLQALSKLDSMIGGDYHNEDSASRRSYASNDSQSSVRHAFLHQSRILVDLVLSK